MPACAAVVVGVSAVLISFVQERAVAGEWRHAQVLLTHASLAVRGRPACLHLSLMIQRRRLEF